MFDEDDWSPPCNGKIPILVQLCPNSCAPLNESFSKAAHAHTALWRLRKGGPLQV